MRADLKIENYTRRIIRKEVLAIPKTKKYKFEQRNLSVT